MNDSNQGTLQGGISGDAARLRQALDALYAGVPATACAGSGECCRLTKEEYRDRFATMFPLYRVEYVNIVHFVRREFSAEVADSLFACRAERPQRCPFLLRDHRCSIYPVRPLICRTYGVMKQETIDAAVVRNRGRVPAEWLRGFACREGGMFCPRVRVLDPEQVAAHADRLIHGAYARELIRLSREVRLLDEQKMAAFAAATGCTQIPLRWSWGGFNTLCHWNGSIQEAALREYWSRAVLVDAN